MRKYIVEKYNLQVNFSDAPGNYYESWKYCSKSDAEVITSANHPTLVELLEQKLLHPKTELLQSQNMMPHLPGKGEKHLTLWIIKNNLKTKTELLRFASKQTEEGRTDVALCVLNNTPRAVKAMQTCWEMLGAVENEKREN